MPGARTPITAARQRQPLAQLQIWHLALLVLYTAIAIADIQNQHLGEPVLIALAGTGFGVYALLGWLGWRMASRFGVRLGRLPLLIAYLIVMATFFLVATIVYLVIEYAYRAALV